MGWIDAATGNLLAFFAKQKPMGVGMNGTFMLPSIMLCLPMLSMIVISILAWVLRKGKLDPPSPVLNRTKGSKMCHFRGTEGALLYVSRVW